MTLRQLTQLARRLQGRGLDEVDAELRRQHLSPEDRVAVKTEAVRLNLAAAAARQGHNLQAGFTLATDLARWNPQDPYQHTPTAYDDVDRKLVAAGFQRGRSYSVREADALLKQSPWASDIETRIGCKARLQALGLLHDDKEAWSDPRQQRAGGIYLNASTERPQGTLLVDRHTGEPVTLRSRP
jgi:hypothetical protein